MPRPAFLRLEYPGGSAGAELHRAAARIRDARATAGHHRIEAVALFLETGQHRSLERAAARQLDAHRIDEAAVDQNFVMDVGAGRLSGRTDKADHLALPHPLADLEALGKR